MSCRGRERGAVRVVQPAAWCTILNHKKSSGIMPVLFSWFGATQRSGSFWKSGAAIVLVLRLG